MRVLDFCTAPGTSAYIDVEMLCIAAAAAAGAEWFVYNHSLFWLSSHVCLCM